MPRRSSSNTLISSAKSVKTARRSRRTLIVVLRDDGVGVVELVEELGQVVDVLGQQRELEGCHRRGHDLPAPRTLQHQLPEIVADGRRRPAVGASSASTRPSPRRSSSLSKILVARTAEYWR